MEDIEKDKILVNAQIDKALKDYRQELNSGIEDYLYERTYYKYRNKALDFLNQRYPYREVHLIDLGYAKTIDPYNLKRVILDSLIWERINEFDEVWKDFDEGNS